MSDIFDIQKIEKKWQKIWKDKQLFSTYSGSSKPKYYVLEMFPYPSGKIHVGHVRNYSIGDVTSRFMRMLGYNVLHPMGWDAFGLPAENAAIAHKVHPQKWTYNHIESMREQLESIGLSYDWSREIITCSPDYYQYEQEFFLKLYHKKVAYQKYAEVNWDPVDKTVLANEQVENGRGWRSGALVEKRKLKTWYLKITDYVDTLLGNLDSLAGWPEHVKLMQKNWIGRSIGAEIIFNVENSEQKILVYSTRPETIFGASFIGIACDHEFVHTISHKSDKIEAFINQARTQDNVAAQDSIYTGFDAIHPFDSAITIPIFITNFVLKDYGTGAIFGCPAHDDRDYNLAKQHNLNIIQVIEGDDVRLTEKAYSNAKGMMINSRFLNGLSVCDAQARVLSELIKQNKGKKKTNYKLRDWGISRQRFWGCPIPIIHCPTCGVVPVHVKDLPVTLPTDIIPDGKGNPLDNHPTWKYTKCPQCASDATRETDTFDTFFESSWYFARFTSPSSEEMVDKNDANYWLPVDQYIGGIEHAVLHLLYARFFHILMQECEYVSCDEPFRNLLNQGMVLHATYKDEAGNWVFPNDVQNHNGQLTHKTTGKKVVKGNIEKMSKSKKNVIDPDSMISEYGADAVRLFVLSDSPPQKDLEWSNEVLEGSRKFIVKLASLSHKILLYKNAGKLEDNKELLSITHRSIKEVTEFIKSFQLNKAVAKMRELYNKIYELLSDNNKNHKGVYEAYIVLLKLLHPYIPHITSEIWEQLSEKEYLSESPWPSYKLQYCTDTITKIAVQINGKLRTVISYNNNLTKNELEELVLSDDIVKKYITNSTIKKLVIVPNKIVNIVI